MKTIEFSVEAAVDHGHGSELTQQLAKVVRAEYAEMPGLSVTLDQAQRLWGVDERTCRRVFDALVARGVLRRPAQGCYVRVAS